MNNPEKPKTMNLKRTMLAALVAAVLIPGGLWARGKTGNARIKVDIERQKGEIDRNIYGNFVEHLGRCIYGGLYEPGSPLSDEKGYRRDVLEATRALRTSLVRWPGGNFVSGYHWEDGIGPQAGRPTRIDLAWGFRESNAFGTDEFVEWCRRAATEPYFCVNLGTGTMDEARNWVEYCNVEKGTYWSDLRRRNGYEKPHKVKYWALGNEMDGQWQMGHKNAEDYGKFALETAKLMKWIDRDIKLVVAGSSDYNGNWIDWNRTVLEYLKNHADYIALHNYVENRSNDYYKFMATTRFAEKAIRITEGLIAEAMTKAERKDPIYIAFDEYNVCTAPRARRATRRSTTSKMRWWYRLSSTSSSATPMWSRWPTWRSWSTSSPRSSPPRKVRGTRRSSTRCSSSPRIATARRSTPSSTVTPMRWAGSGSLTSTYRRPMTTRPAK